MENGRIEPLRALPVTPVGQIYTMYIDFPLDEFPSPRPPPIFSLSPGGPPGRVLAPSCSKSAGEGLEAGGPPGNPPKIWPERAGIAPGTVEAPKGPWRPRPLEAPACKPACGGPVFLLEGARRRSFRGGN